MHTIVTKHMAATNNRGERIKAISDLGSVVITWNYDLDTIDNHIGAAQSLAAKYMPHISDGHKIQGGPLPEAIGYGDYVWMFVSKANIK